MATTLTDNTCRTCGGSTGTSITDHEAAADPHPQYLTQADGDALYASSGDGSGAVSTHEAAADPHPAYLLEADAASTYRTSAQVQTTADGAVSTHEAAADPHPDYVLNSELATLQTQVDDASGWASYRDDTTVTSLLANTATDLPNVADTTNETQMPSDLTEMYETTGSTIVGETAGDLLEIQVEFTIDPGTADGWLDVWLDDTVTERFRETIALPKGTVEHRVRSVMIGTVDADWVTNGMTVRVQSEFAADVYDVVFTVARLHAA